MHLISRRKQAINMGSEHFILDEGETLHTECSYKYTLQGLQAMALQAGFRPAAAWVDPENLFRSEEHTSELQSLMRISYAVFCLKKKNESSLYFYHVLINTL